MRLRDPLGFRQLICVDTHGMHQQVVNCLKSIGRPAIVIAGNGMCSGGRIVNYLKVMLGDSRHEVVFVRLQVKRTPGAVLQGGEGAEGTVQIDLDGVMYEVRLKIFTLEGYSSHADRVGLIDFAAGMIRPPKSGVLVLGEAHVKSL